MYKKTRLFLCHYLQQAPTPPPPPAQKCQILALDIMNDILFIINSFIGRQIHP